MSLRKVINDYVECNNFEIKITNKKVKVYYYDNIENFTSSKVTISKDNELINIKGKDLVIETMFKEYLVISGKINSIELGSFND